MYEKEEIASIEAIVFIIELTPTEKEQKTKMTELLPCKCTFSSSF